MTCRFPRSTYTQADPQPPGETDTHRFLEGMSVR